MQLTVLYNFTCKILCPSHSKTTQMFCMDVRDLGNSHNVHEFFFLDERQMGGIQSPHSSLLNYPISVWQNKSDPQNSKMMGWSTENLAATERFLILQPIIRVEPGNSRHCLWQTPYMWDQIHFGTQSECCSRSVEMDIGQMVSPSCPSLVPVLVGLSSTERESQSNLTLQLCMYNNPAQYHPMSVQTIELKLQPMADVNNYEDGMQICYPAHKQQISCL